MRKYIAIAALALVGSVPAWADGLTLAGAVSVTGNGFGNDARALTIQSQQSAMESGCVAPGPTVGAGACAPGFGNYGGDETNPTGFPKISAPTLSSLGITSGSQLGILFDAVQPQNANNDYVNVNDLTLKLYNTSGVLIWTASGSWSNLLTNPGNGTSDYLFVLDSAAISSFNAAFGGNGSDIIALDSTISFANNGSGPDSYSFVNMSPNVTPAPTPEPSSLALLGTGMFGMGFWMYSRKRRTSGSLAM